MNAKRLYKVEIAATMLVMATHRQEAESVAKGNLSNRIALNRLEMFTDPVEPEPAADVKAAVSPFAGRMLRALHLLTLERVAHPCGGFTTDDMQWRMGLAFTPDETLHEALEELERAGLIRFAGIDDDDAIGTCYEACPEVPDLQPEGGR